MRTAPLPKERQGMNTLWQAAQKIRGHYHKGDYADGKGNYCMLGAMASVRGVQDTILTGDEEGDILFDHEFNAQENILKEIIEEQFPDRLGLNRFPGVPTFNDHPDTTEDEVVAVLEKSAVRWDERVE